MAAIVANPNPRSKKKHIVRWYANGEQHQKAFERKRGPDGADAYAVWIENQKRENVYVDPKIANTKFAEVAADWLARHLGSPKTLQTYELALRRHILPEFGTKGLAAVAADRDGVERFLRDTLPKKNLGPSTIRTCYMVINAIVNDAIRSGKLNQTRLRGMRLPAQPQRAEIVFASRRDIRNVAGFMLPDYRFTVYLMRGCGLRLGEALGVRASDFMDGGNTLRLQRQARPDGKGCIPMKHREDDDYRDIPVPAYVDEAMPLGFTEFAAVSHRQYREWFNKARDTASLPRSFTPHTLRHIFASVCLAGGIPITDVSKWLGHRSIQVTYGIYGHLVPASWERARGVLDEEWGA